MTDPSKERIAAALALAEALEPAMEAGTSSSLWNEVHRLRSAYRATLPVLRTRAEVDQDIADCVRNHQQPGGTMLFDGLLRGELERLCAEPTQPTYGPSSVDGADPTPRPRAAAGATLTDPDLPDPDPCSCDQAIELQRIVRHVHSLAVEMVRVTETTPG